MGIDPHKNDECGSTVPSILMGHNTYEEGHPSYLWDLTVNNKSPRKSNMQLLFRGNMREKLIIDSTFYEMSDEKRNWPSRYGIDIATIDTEQKTIWGTIKCKTGTIKCRDTSDGIITLSNGKSICIEAKYAEYADRSIYQDPLNTMDYNVDAESIIDLSAVPESTVSDMYYDQCQWHMYWTECEMTFLIMEFNKCMDPFVYVVRRNDEYIKKIFKAVVRFWTKYVFTGKRPPTDESKGHMDYLRRKDVYNDSFKKSTMKNHTDMHELLTTKEYIKKLTKHCQSIANRLAESATEDGQIGIEFQDAGRFTFIKNEKTGKRTFRTSGIKTTLLAREKQND